MKTIAIIPCYNEEETIGDIVTIAQKHVDKVVVCDDASTDNTAFIAGMRGAVVLKHKEHHGVGYMMQGGFNVARWANADVIITLDGDGQHNPDDIPSLVKPIVDGIVDVVFGTRKEKGQMPKYRRFGNAVVNWLCNVNSSCKISDNTCGFRAFSRESLQILLPISEQKFGSIVEMLIKAKARGLKIAEVPIQCIYHKNYRQNSTLNPIILGIILVWKTTFWRLKTSG
jgi:glycosyltransferase involved in cell wall biosynthesis